MVKEEIWEILLSFLEHIKLIKNQKPRSILEAVINEWMNSIEQKMKDSNFDSFKGLIDDTLKEFRFQFLSIEDYYNAESEI